MIPDPSSKPKFGTWKHNKSGNLYEIIGFGLSEKSLVPVVLYQRISSPMPEGQVWVRPCYEFFDGRYERT